MFIGLAPLVGVIVSAAISVASSYLISALSRPKQDKPEGRIPGSAIGRNIPEGFNVFVVDEVMWIEPAEDSRMFVPRGNDKLYFTGVGAIAHCDGGCEMEKLWVAGAKEFDFGGSTEFIDDEVVFNNGLQSQPVEWKHPKWKLERPADDYVAYLGIATIGFYSLGVHKRGLSAPAIKLVLKGKDTHTVGSICKKKAIDAGILESTIDISEIETEPCRGFTCDRNGNSYYQQLEPLLVNHFVGIVEQPNGKLKFKKIAREDVVVDIPLEHLGVRKEGDRLEYLITRNFTDTNELPRAIIFNFIDSGEFNLSDFEQATVESDYHPRATSTHIENISTDELLSRPEAKVIANKLLYQIWDRSVSYEFTLPFDYKDTIEPLDIVTINNTYTVQIDTLTLTADFRINVKAFEYKPASIKYEVSGENAIASPVSTTPVSTTPDNTESNAIAIGELTLIDTPLVFSENAEIGVYCFANTSGNIYLSRDGGSSYTESISLTTAVYGTCQTVLGFETTDINSNTYPINTNLELENLPILDNTSTLTVTASNGSISSLTPSQFENEEVLIFVGSQINGVWEGEFICANVAIASSGNYILSELKRGLRGTEYYMDKHAANESFFVVDRNTPRLSLNQSDINQQLLYKFQVSDTQDLDGITPKSINFLGQGINSYGPTDLFYTQDETGNITFEFTPRSRLGDLQLGEQSIHELHLLDTQDAVIRSITGSTIKYSQSNQTADNLVPPFKINLYRINQINGRGYPGYFREITLSTSIPFIPLTDSLYRGIKTVDSASVIAYTLTTDDRGLLIRFNTTTASIEVTLPDTLDSGFYVGLENVGSGNLTLVDINTDETLGSPYLEGEKVNTLYDGSTWVQYESIRKGDRTTSITTASLAQGASEDIDLDINAIALIKRITADKQTRIRIFGTASDRASDTTDVTTQLIDQSGLAIDLYLPTSALSYRFAKGLVVNNLDIPSVNKLYLKVFNDSGATNTVQIDIDYALL